MINMPSLEKYKQINNKSIGNVFREQSDMIMEQTWDSDIQSRICYIYDYYHEDESEKDKYRDIEHDDDTTNKLKIDAKFIVTAYGSFTNERVEYHLMFKPSERFSIDDSIVRSEKDNLKLQEMKAIADSYKFEFPIGLYIDIPDAKNVYRRWLIVDRNYEQQFIKFSILPCEKYYHWFNNGRHNMWGVSRSISTYSSRVSANSVFTVPDTQEQFILPFNDITKNVNYDMRFILDENWVKVPKVYKVFGVTNPHSYGLYRIDLEQTPFTAETDKLVDGYWYADYDVISDIKEEEPNIGTDICSLSCGNYSNINIGGTRTITTTFLNDRYEEVSSYSMTSKSNYSFVVIDDEEEIDASDFIAVSQVNDDYKKIKIKYLNNAESNCYRTCILKITACDDDNKISGSIQLKIS